MGIALVSIGVRDDAGSSATLPIYIEDTGLTLADVQGFADLMAGLVDDITDGVVTNIAITFNHTLPAGLKASAVADSSVQKSGLFTFELVDSKYALSVRVPAMKEAFVTSGNIDTAATEVAAFISAINSGLVPDVTLVYPTNQFGFDVSGLRKAVLTFRK